MKYISKLLVLFAIGMMATACSNDINEVNYPLTVTTPMVSSVNATSAVVTATATGSHITYRGICYSTSPNPTINDNKVLSTGKNMILTISGLAKNTTYVTRELCFSCTAQAVKKHTHRSVSRIFVRIFFCIYNRAKLC